MHQKNNQSITAKQSTKLPINRSINTAPDINQSITTIMSTKLPIITAPIHPAIHCLTIIHPAKLIYLNFQPREVVDHGSKTQPRVVENT